MDRSLEELRTKAKTANGNVKEQLSQAISDLTKRAEAVRQDLKALQTASADGYDAAKTRFDTAMQDLKDGVEKTGSRVQ